MNPFRCSNCNKLLGMIEGKAEIKCSKCKTMNKGITTKEYLSEVMTNNCMGLRIPYNPNGINRYD
jgi:LSD1 subclass zinc finger protein